MKYDAGVDSWLKTLAGPRYPELASWLVAFHKDHALPVLHLFGEGRCGKSMLASAITLNWPVVAVSESGLGVGDIRPGRATIFTSNSAVSPLDWLHIKCVAEARDCLEQNDTSDWVVREDGGSGRIAEHIRWMQAEAA